MRASLAFLLLSGTLLGQTARLEWDASTDPTVTGYKAYWGKASGSYTTSIDVGNVTACVVTGMGGGLTYYVVTAYNSAGIESLPSNEAVSAPKFWLWPNGVADIGVTGQKGQAFSLEASSTLVDWVTIFAGTILDSALPVIVTDSDAPNWQRRFYRVRY